MNSEKIQALFESMEIAADELKKATGAANKIRISNDKDEKITKLISDFHAVQTNTQRMKKDTDQAIADMRKAGIKYKLTGILGLFSTTIMIGLAIGYASITAYKNEIIAHELESIKEERAKIQSQYAFVNELKKKGMEIYKDAIVLPSEYAGKISVTEDGRLAIFQN